MLETGATFHDRYRVVRCIKLGGMGSVHEVFDSVTERSRALKTMLPTVLTDPDMRSRFASEARVTAPIRSQHVVEVFDAGIDATTGSPFLVMELLDGEDLGAILRRRGRLPKSEVVDLLRQLAMALDRTHDAGIVHRDLKPENLFVTRRDDGAPHLKVLDYGIAKVLAKNGDSATTRNLGTPLYMAPEQVRGDRRIDRRADLYSTGQIAFALLTGRPYFELEANDCSTPYGLLLWVAHGPPEPASIRAASWGIRLPARFDTWFSRATALDPAARFPSAREMVAALATTFDVGARRDATSPITSGDQSLETRSRSEGPEPVVVQGLHGSSRWTPSRTAYLLVFGVAALGVGSIWLSRSEQWRANSSAPDLPIHAAAPSAITQYSSSAHSTPISTPTAVRKDDVRGLPSTIGIDPPAPKPRRQKPRSAPKESTDPSDYL